MSKNPYGMITRGNKEWGSKTRKEEDRLRGHRRRGKVEAIGEYEHGAQSSWKDDLS
jgi:hypothetical protein